MKRALFMHEIERALLLQVGVIGLVIAVLATATYLGGQIPFTRALLGVLLFSGFIAGGYPFAKGFQKKQWPLLLTLPIDRSTTWTLIMLAHSSASLLSIITLVILTSSEDSLHPFAAPFVIAYATFFCVSSFISLTADHDVNSFGDLRKKFSVEQLKALPVAFTGGALLVNAFVQTWYISLSLGLAPDENVSIDTFPRIDDAIVAADLSFAILGSLFLSVGYLALGRALFIRAENRLPAVRHRFNWLMLAFGIVCVSVLPVASGTFATFSAWRFHDARVSTDGKYLAVIEQAEGHPAFARLSVVDLANGSALGVTERKGIHSVVWSRADSVLGVDIKHRPISPIVRLNLPGLKDVETPPIVRWINSLSLPWANEDHVGVFSADLRQMEQTEFDQVLDMQPLPDGRIAIVNRKASSASVLARDAKTGTVETLVTGSYETRPMLYSIGRRLVVDFWSLSNESNVWLIDQGAKELEWADSKKDPRPRYIIGGVVYTLPTTVNAALARLVGRPPAATRGAYLISSVDTASQSNSRIVFADSSSVLFYVSADPDTGHDNLFVLDRELNKWNRFETQFKFIEDDDNFITSSEKVFVAADRFSNLRVDNERGLAAYIIESNGKAGMRLYDARRKTLVDLGAVSPIMPSTKLELQPLPGLDGILISYGNSVFVYTPESGQFAKVDILAKSLKDVRYLTADGTHIYIDDGKVLQKRGGAVQTVWPQ